MAASDRAVEVAEDVVSSAGVKHHTGPVGLESGSVTAGKGDSFARAGLPCGFKQRTTLPLLV
jgi:hypothetical protein